MSQEVANELTLVTDAEIREARQILWNQGVLEWKLDPCQRKIFDFLKNKPDKTLIVNASRRLGKSYALLILAFEQCLKNPGSIVKFLQPEVKMLRTNIIPIINEIIFDCPKEIAPEYKSQDNKYVFPNGSQIQLAGTDNGNYMKLRGGNCLGENTQILTPNGPIAIKDINIGDIVYGFNEDGSVSETIVKNKYYNGIKEVTEIFGKHQFIGTCTDEHKWMTTSLNSIKYNKLDTIEKQFKSINENNDRITQRVVKIPCGIVNEPHAYVLGAMIGDGCSSSDIGNYLKIASEDCIIPKKCADILNLNYKHISGYNWKISSTIEHGKHSNKNLLNYYDLWLKGKSCFNKNFDYLIVNTWNRESCLKLIAGLTDTDGNVFFNKKDSSLEWSYTSVNLDLIKNIQKIIFKLLQFTPSIKIRNGRHNKEYTLRIRNSFYVKNLLKEITPYLALTRKGYQDYMNNIKSKHTGKYLKITKGNKSFQPTYDIEVNNKTHLYLTANGLVTHNSHLAIIDEAGFCTDLEHIINYILIPTTTLTKGKIILSSTTPPNNDHEFNKYMEFAEIENRLIRKTIYDAVSDHELMEKPRINLGMVADIIKSLPDGENAESFKTEYLCLLPESSSTRVVPEFTKEIEQDVIINWPKPPFYDAYVSMDIGFLDLTAVLFAYYDFNNAVIVIEDEFSINGPEMRTKKLAEKIREYEDRLYTHPMTGEFKEPYLRVSDNNLILINDLQRDHYLTFFPTEKNNKESYINEVRNLVSDRKIIINPKCIQLITHLRMGTWEKSRKDYKRSADNGHYDFLDALVYLVRNLDRNKNPYPKGYQFTRLGGSGNVFKNPYSTPESNSLNDKISEMFKVKSTFRKLK